MQWSAWWRWNGREYYWSSYSQGVPLLQKAGWRLLTKPRFLVSDECTSVSIVVLESPILEGRMAWEGAAQEMIYRRPAKSHNMQAKNKEKRWYLPLREGGLRGPVDAISQCLQMWVYLGDKTYRVQPWLRLSATKLAQFGGVGDSVFDNKSRSAWDVKLFEEWSVRWKEENRR